MTKIFKAVFNSKKTQHPEGDKVITVIVEAKLKKQAETFAEQELAFWENEFHYLYKKPVMSEVEQSDLIEYLATKEKANQVDLEEISGDSYQISDSIDLIDIRNEMDSEDFPFNCGYYDTLSTLYIAFGAKKSYTKKELKLIWMWLDNDEAVSVDISEDNRKLVSKIANHYNEINDTSNNRIIIDEVFDLTKLAMSGEEHHFFDAKKQPVTIISQTGITIKEDNLSDDASNETGTTLNNDDYNYAALTPHDDVLLWAGYAPVEVSGVDNTRYRIKSGAYILGTVIENDGLYNYESDKTAMTYAWGGTVDILLTEQSKNSDIKSIVDSAVSVVSKRKATEEFIKKQEILERLAAMGYDCGQQEQESEIPEKVTAQSHPELFKLFQDECSFDTSRTPKHGKGYVTPEIEYEGNLYRYDQEVVWDYSWGIEEWMEKECAFILVKEETSSDDATILGNQETNPQKLETLPANQENLPVKQDIATEEKQEVANVVVKEVAEVVAKEVETLPPAKPEKTALDIEIEKLNAKIANLKSGEVLRIEDISNNAYHGSDGNSSTKIKDACVSLMYYNGIYNTKEIEKARGVHFNVGNLAHTLTLEPENVGGECVLEPEITRPTEPQRKKYDEWVKLGKPSKEDNKKAYPTELMLERCQFWDDFMAGHEDIIIVDKDNWKIAQNMANAVTSHPDAGKILSHPQRKSEVSYFKRDEETGLGVKVRPDIEVGALIADLKTIQLRTNPDEEWLLSELRREVRRRKYHLSAAMYLDVTGKKQFVWIFVNKEPGYHWVAIVKASAETLAEGHELYRQKLNAIADAYETNYWPEPSSIGKALNLDTNKMQYPEI